MANKKQIIQISVIVVAFLAAGYILYSGGLFGSNATWHGSSASLSVGAGLGPGLGAGQSSGDVLPYGNILQDPKDFDKVINHNRFQYDLIQYPKLDPQNEVGVPENSVITAPAAQ